MSQVALNIEPHPQSTPVSEYSDFARQELAIALNSRKRGKLVLEIVHEKNKEHPDFEKIGLLNQKAQELILEKREIYLGNIAMQNKVIDTYNHG